MHLKLLFKNLLYTLDLLAPATSRRHLFTFDSKLMNTQIYCTAQRKFKRSSFGGPTTIGPYICQQQFGFITERSISTSGKKVEMAELK